MRERYKWPPSVIDPIPIQRLITIYEEAVEDMPKGPEDEDFE